MTDDRTITERLMVIEADVVTIKQQLAELLAILRPDPTPPTEEETAAEEIAAIVDGLFDDQPFELAVIDGKLVRL